MSKSGVQYIKQSVPQFLRDFKEKVGYKERPDVDTKRQELDIDDGSDSEDEKPQIVVLKKGDLSQEEVERLSSEGALNYKEGTVENDDPSSSDGKILFKNPGKRSKDATESELTVLSKKKKSKDKDLSISKSSNEKLKKKNTSLLSFDDEEEEDG